MENKFKKGDMVVYLCDIHLPLVVIDYQWKVTNYFYDLQEENGQRHNGVAENLLEKCVEPS